MSFAELIRDKSPVCTLEQYGDRPADMIVPLTAEDRAMTDAFVQRLLAVKWTKQIASLTDTQKLAAEVTGKLAEIACARVWSWTVDWRVGLDGDGHVDFRLTSGATVDVKSVAVRHERAMDHDFRLALVGDERPVADYYVLALLNPAWTAVHICGGISRDRFKRLGAPDPAVGANAPWSVRRSALSVRYPWHV